MYWLAVRMLVGSPGKYLMIVLGVAFSSLLMTQQSSIFCGILRLTASQIRDLRERNRVARLERENAAMRTKASMLKTREDALATPPGAGE